MTDTKCKSGNTIVILVIVIAVSAASFQTGYQEGMRGRHESESSQALNLSAVNGPARSGPLAGDAVNHRCSAIGNLAAI